MKVFAVFVLFGLFADSISDSIDPCQWIEAQNCAVACHGGGCQNHFKDGITLDLVGLIPTQETSFIAVSILVPLDRAEDLFHPPKTIA